MIFEIGTVVNEWLSHGMPLPAPGGEGKLESRFAVFGHKARGQVERILRVFEGKAAAFEALGDQKIVGLSMREADLVAACGH